MVKFIHVNSKSNCFYKAYYFYTQNGRLLKFTIFLILVCMCILMVACSHNQGQNKQANKSTFTVTSVGITDNSPPFRPNSTTPGDLENISDKTNSNNQITYFSGWDLDNKSTTTSGKVLSGSTSSGSSSAADTGFGSSIENTIGTTHKTKWYEDPEWGDLG